MVSQRITRGPQPPFAMQVRQHCLLALSLMLQRGPRLGCGSRRRFQTSRMHVLYVTPSSYQTSDVRRTSSVACHQNQRVGLYTPGFWCCLAQSERKRTRPTPWFVLLTSPANQGAPRPASAQRLHVRPPSPTSRKEGRGMWPRCVGERAEIRTMNELAAQDSRESAVDLLLLLCKCT